MTRPSIKPSLASTLWSSKRFAVAVVMVGVVIVLFAYRSTQQVKEYRFYGSVMGTTYHVKYVANNLSQTQQQTLANAVATTLQGVDNAMSTYKASSELMKLNAWPVNQPFSVSKALAQLLLKSFRVSELSHGAYDVTVGSLVNLWGFGPPLVSPHQDEQPAFIQWKNGTKHPVLPTQQAINRAKQEIGYQYVKVDLNGWTVTKKKPLFIDLSSIAKGYGVDQAALMLRKHHIDNFMVEVGGEVSVRGYRLANKPWRVGIRSPENGEQQPLKVFNLTNESLATSGDYLNYYNDHHHRYNHEINPKTGKPENYGIASASVIADNTALADAYATMFMVLPKEIGQALAQKHHIAVYIIYRNANDKTFSTYASPALVAHSETGV